MSFFFFFLSVVTAVVAYKFKTKSEDLESQFRTRSARMSELKEENDKLALEAAANRTEIQTLKAEVASLAKYRIITDAEEKAKSIIAAAQAELDAAQKAAVETKNAASVNAQRQVEAASLKLQEARREAGRIIAAADKRAEEIAGDAFKALQKADSLESTAKAMKNLIEGYGDQYIVPTYSLLDELAEEFGFAEAGAELKKARERTKYMVKNGQAAVCDYVEANRKETAIRFVVDAFNGKVDSILSRTKADNIGTLKQAILDAFSLVNHNGSAFRNAKIKEEFLEGRLEELKWAVIAMELRERDREEQRRIKEQIRDEERARREFEKAIRDAEKEEEMLHKAMEKIQKDADKASEEQKVVYEAKLLELQEKLRAAEDRSQRAMSMAQQTRAGHVYVISNIGSFGEDVLKIGMTRRLEPKDRVRELGDASVPFEFDIHAMIYSEDAPGLEKTLHRSFLKTQMNKVNPRKEFFKVSLADIRSEVEALGATVHWTMTAAAKDFRESLAIERALLTNPESQKEWLQQQIEVVNSMGPIEDEGDLALVSV